mgnify:CR=1 FL=1
MTEANFYEEERRMEEVLANPASTYTKMCEAIDKFFVS